MLLVSTLEDRVCQDSGLSLVPVSYMHVGYGATSALRSRMLMMNVFIFLNKFPPFFLAAQIKNLMSQLGTKQDSSKLQENL